MLSIFAIDGLYAGSSATGNELSVNALRHEVKPSLVRGAKGPIAVCAATDRMPVVLPYLTQKIFHCIPPTGHTCSRSPRSATSMRPAQRSSMRSLVGMMSGAQTNSAWTAHQERSMASHIACRCGNVASVGASVTFGMYVTEISGTIDIVRHPFQGV